LRHIQRGGFQVVTCLAIGALVALSVSCDSSPTAPSDPSVIAIDVGPGPSGSGGQIIVRADACECNNASLQLVLNGVSQTSIGCGEERILVVAAGQHTLKVYSSAFSGALSATFTVSSTQGALVLLSCR
jgi:hypothetical protein